MEDPQGGSRSVPWRSRIFSKVARKPVIEQASITTCSTVCVIRGQEEVQGRRDVFSAYWGRVKKRGT